MPVHSSLLNTPSLEAFANQNPDFDLLTFPLYHPQKVAELNWEGINKGNTLDQLKTYQRLLRLSPNDNVANALYTQGITSAHQVASMSENTFVKKYSQVLPGGKKTATQVYGQAITVDTKMQHLWATIHSLSSSHFKALRGNNMNAEMMAFFESVPSYQDMFGNLNYCECEHCKSIFGPAAYFVDMMRITDRYIVAPNIDTIPPDLLLEARRPDLGEIELTCENTNTLIPYIQIVNEVLERRAAVEMKTVDVYQALATTTYPFNLPFQLPLEEIQLYIKALDTSLADIYETFTALPTKGTVQEATGTTIKLESTASAQNDVYIGMRIELLGQSYNQTRLITAYNGTTRTVTVDSSIGTVPSPATYKVSGSLSVAQAALDLSLEQYAIFITPVTSESGLSAFYGLPISGSTLGGLIYEDTFLFQTKLLRKQLEMLLTQNLSTEEWDAGIAHQFYINQVLSGNTFLSIQVDGTNPDRNIIQNLSLSTLDTVNRFVRFAQHLGWEFTDLNWTLTALYGSPGGKIDQDAVINIALVEDLQQRLNQPLDMLNSFWYDMKTIGSGNITIPLDLFDRVYNSPSLIGDTPPYHPVYSQNPTYTDPVQTWKVSDKTDTNLVFGRSRMTAALQISDNTLTDIGEAFWGKGATVDLTVPNLSRLYRTARMLAILGLTMQQYQILLSFIGISVQTLDRIPPQQLMEILDLAAWMTRAGLTVNELDYILNGTVGSPVFKAPISQDVHAIMQSLWTLEAPILLTPQSFTFDTITTKQSEEIFIELVSRNLIVPVRDQYIAVFHKDYPTEMAIVLQEAVQSDLLFLKTKPGLDDAQVAYVHKTLQTFLTTQTQFLNQQISGIFNLDPNIGTGLMYYFARAEGLDTYLILLLTPLLPDSLTWQNIISLFKSITQMIPLIDNLSLTDKELRSMADTPLAYGISNPLQLTTLNIYTLYTFKQLMNTFNDRLDQFAEYLNMPADSDCAVGVKSNALSELTGWPREQICQALLYYGMGTSLYDTVNGVALLNQAFTIGTLMGVDITFFRPMLLLKNLPVTGQTGPLSNWQIYKEMSSTLKETVNAKYDDKQWLEVNKKLCGQLNEIKRDALQGMVLWKLNQKYTDLDNLRDLYNFLLIDIEMSDCAQISYIREALNAIQLYMQRAHLNLEQGILFIEIPEVWWEWMSNYRLWEANRKIFLYPENYLDPTLRSNETTLFAALQEELLQNEITDETITEAFTAYLDGFSALAKLKYVDSYRCTVNDEKRGPIDTTFFFARTEGDPPTYYYIACEFGEVWSEWTKIEQTIESFYVTPLYAFNRLFLFWVDVKKITNSTIDTSGSGTESKNSSVYQATIKYSFFNFSGEWVQPQVLAQELIVNIAPDQYTNAMNAVAGWDEFNMNNIYWHKVYALRVMPDNYQSIPRYSSKEEKITIVYGPKAHKISLGRPVPSSASSSQAQFIFDTQLFTDSLVVDQAQRENLYGFTPTVRSMTLNMNLNKDFLMRDTEYMVLRENKDVGRPPSFRPEVDTTYTRLGIIDSLNVIADNYMGDFTPPVSGAIPGSKATPDSFIAPGIDKQGSQQVYIDLKANGIIMPDDYVDKYFNSTTDLSFLFEGAPPEEKKVLTEEVRQRLFVLMGTPVLLEVISQRNASTVTVKNQPGWFLFDNGNEAFMMTAYKNTYPSISGILQVKDVLSSPKVYNDSFVSYDISLNDSKQVYADLLGNNIITGSSTEGYLDKYFNSHTDLSFLFAGALPAQKEHLTREVKNVLLSLPSTTSLEYYVKNDDAIVTQDSFITPNINQAGSQQVYIDLKANGIITEDNLVDPYFSASTDLSFLFAGAPPKEKAMLTKEVQTILFQYWDAAWVVNIHDLSFRTDRITTAAVNRLSQNLFTGGIDRLLSLESQQIPVVPKLPFDRFLPGVQVIPPPISDGEQVDFRGPYGKYYWEVFFQAPFLIAFSLNGNQKFSAAQQWYQYIYNPTALEQFIHPDSFVTPDISIEDSQEAYQQLITKLILIPVPDVVNASRVSVTFTPTTNLSFLFPNENDPIKRARMITEVRNVLLNHYMVKSTLRFWNFEPFRNYVLESLESMLTNQLAIATYNNDPFDPFAIADLRIGAYEKTIVMRYIDNLLDWGDYLFAQYTWESITTATLLYVYAYDLLGDRPENMGPCSSQPPVTYNEIRRYYEEQGEEIPEFLIFLEQMVPPSGKGEPMISASSRPFNDIDAYFCIPENEVLMDYWNRVEDRLFKIRHCMTIAGVQQQLALFEPPIDPMQLVKAAAAGGTMDVVSQLKPVIPHYRFTSMLGRAQNITATLMQLGGSLLAALEKKDAEDLALLRAVQEENILKLTTSIKVKQIEQAQENIAALQESQKSAQTRYDFYSALLRDGLSSSEQANLNAMAVALAFNIAASITRTASSIAYTIPQVGSPFAMTYGGVQIGSALAAASGVFEIGSEISSFVAQRSLTMSGYERRAQDWQLQSSLAQQDVVQIQKQIDSAKIALTIAQQELVIHQKSIEQAQEVELFLKDKFTNRELYQWMSGRISTLYFQTYKIALEMALAAQSAYQYELNRDDTFVNFGYWDSLKKGLLAGEGLMLSLNQMEQAYTNNNARRLEIQKTVSLLLTAPEEVMNLKSTGTCAIRLDEKMFDYDYPGQYCRQIKSVSITIPAVVGPYQNIKAVLTQTSNTVVLKESKDAVAYLLDPQPGDEAPLGLRQNWLTNQQIALSTGINDTGMFELSFGDERYLPFEGTGAVSTWELNMPLETNRINFDSISDVIVQVNYTALQGSKVFQNEVKDLLADDPYTGAKYLSLHQSFSSAWYAFMTDHTNPDTQTLKFPITSAILLPNLPTAKITSVLFKLDVSSDVVMPATSNFMKLKIAGNAEQPVPFETIYGTVTGLQLTKKQFEGEWQIIIDLSEVPDPQHLLKDGFLNPEAFLNLEMIVNYEAEIF